MAIAANFRKFPEAMALQFVLLFGLPVWNSSRPTTRLGRMHRAFVTAAMKLRGLVEYPQKPSTPAWLKKMQLNARALAKKIKAQCMTLDLRQCISKKEIEQCNRYKQHLLQMKIDRGELLLV